MPVWRSFHPTTWLKLAMTYTMKSWKTMAIRFRKSWQWATIATSIKLPVRKPLFVMALVIFRLKRGRWWRLYWTRRPCCLSCLALILKALIAATLPLGADDARLWLCRAGVDCRSGMHLHYKLHCLRSSLKFSQRTYVEVPPLLASFVITPFFSIKLFVFSCSFTLFLMICTFFPINQREKNTCFCNFGSETLTK